MAMALEMALEMATAMATANNTPPCTVGYYRSQLATNLHVYDRKGQIELELAGFGKHDPALIGNFSGLLLIRPPVTLQV